MKKLGILTSILALFSCGTNGQDFSNIKNIKAAELDSILQTEKPIILDIRTKGEYNQGHLKNALNLDFYSPDFKTKVAKLDKEKTYVLYCRSGNRSGQSLVHFTDFKKIYHLNRGYRTVK